LTRLGELSSQAESPAVAARKIPERKERSKYKQNRVATELYLFPKRERENIDKTHEKQKEMVVATKSGSGVGYARGRY
jgi:hypothetical protein